MHAMIENQREQIKKYMKNRQNHLHFGVESGLAQKNQHEIFFFFLGGGVMQLHVLHQIPHSIQWPQKK